MDNSSDTDPISTTNSNNSKPKLLPAEVLQQILNSLSSALTEIQKAISLLSGLHEEKDDTSVASCSSENIINDLYYSEGETSSSSDTEMVAVNPIGVLNDMCRTHDWDMPVYKMTEVTGELHKCNFNMTCTFGEIVMTGQGPRKQCAKRIAANKVLKRLMLTRYWKKLRPSSSSTSSSSLGSITTSSSSPSPPPSPPSAAVNYE